MAPRPTPGTRQRGATIEAAAREFLRRAGLREVAANAGYRVGETDLVMLDPTPSAGSVGGRHAATLVFIEVRYRRSAGFGGGAASVDAGKRRRLVRAAQSFLVSHPGYANAPCRFDVIDASGDPNAPLLDWIRDAFRADDV